MDRKIDVMIVGAQKAGTTSLLRYLGEHPDCISHPQKEFSYFTDQKEYSLGFKKAFTKYYSHQPYHKGMKVIAKNAGLYTRDECIKKLKKHNPDCQIIYILRNPVDRTYSSYLMEKHAGSAKFDFSDLPELIQKFDENDESWGFDFFIDYSLYANHLKTIYSYFPKEQVTVLLYEDLKSFAEEICKTLFEKIGVPSDFKPNVSLKHNVTHKTRSSYYARVIRKLLHNENPLKKAVKQFIPGHKTYKYGEMLREVNKTKKKPESVDEKAKRFLIEYYKPFNKELETLIGKDLSSWNQ